MNAKIPMPRDVAELIGDFAKEVENRSLLFDKFVFHKSCPVDPEEVNYGDQYRKWDDASRWSCLRIGEEAKQVLEKESNDKRSKSQKQKNDPEKADKLRAESVIARRLSEINWNNETETNSIREKSNKRFIDLIISRFKNRSRITIAQLKSRLAINLSDGLIENAGICLDKLFGLPYIPGSAIKGVSRHAALAELKTKSDQEIPPCLSKFCEIFGCSNDDFKNGDLKLYSSYLNSKFKERKGAVTFLPAYPFDNVRLVVDMTTVHYPEYYNSGRTSDLKNEQLRPNPFPAVEMGSQFAFCLVLNGMGQNQELIEEAKSFLIEAITVSGIGAKTAAGFGWFSLRDDLLEIIQKEAQSKADQEALEQEKIEKIEIAAKAEKERRSNLTPEVLAAEELKKLEEHEFAEVAKSIALNNDESKDQILNILCKDQVKKKRWEPWLPENKKGKDNEPSDTDWQVALSELLELLLSDAGKRSFISLLRDDPEKRQRWKTWKRKKEKLASGIQSVCKELKLQELP